MLAMLRFLSEDDFVGGFLFGRRAVIVDGGHDIGQEFRPLLRALLLHHLTQNFDDVVAGLLTSDPLQLGVPQTPDPKDHSWERTLERHDHLGKEVLVAAVAQQDARATKHGEDQQELLGHQTSLLVPQGEEPTVLGEMVLQVQDERVLAIATGTQVEHLDLDAGHEARGHQGIVRRSPMQFPRLLFGVAVLAVLDVDHDCLVRDESVILHHLVPRLVTSVMPNSVVRLVDGVKHVLKSDNGQSGFGAIDTLFAVDVHQDELGLGPGFEPEVFGLLASRRLQTGQRLVVELLAYHALGLPLHVSVLDEILEFLVKHLLVLVLDLQV